MAYITKDEIKEIRNNIKKALPTKNGWKISVVRDNYSSVNIRIFQAPKESGLPEGHHPVNHLYVDKHWEGNEPAIKALTTITDIALANHWDESDAMTDYFNCAYYVHVEIGAWDRACKLV